MYLLDDGVKVNAEVQSSPVDDIQEISQRIGYAHEVGGFDGFPQFAGFFFDEFASADSAVHGNARPGAHGGADMFMKLANQPGRRGRYDDVVWIHANIVARHRASSPALAFGSYGSGGGLRKPATLDSWKAVSTL